MSMKISKTNPDLEYLYARLDEVRMSGHDRLRAKASLARAEAVADLFIAVANAIHRLLNAIVIKPFRRLTATLG